MTVVSPELRVGSDGESSPATVAAKSNFRELDDAFLQTQTRIWLGEVLQIRFDEETDISDILADGKLLFELSEVLSRMLPSLSVDATQSKASDLKSFVSSKSSQRYMPYYNVGSFLKMCKNLGLEGIDLFTPSDVVDKRNTRKVCMCLRSLSKRARSRGLIVPDFESVTCTLTMPTNMVECIRKSLEKSHSSSSLSLGQEADKVSNVRSWNASRISSSASIVSNECSSDICDDAESSLLVGATDEPSDYKYDESPDVSRSEVVGDHNPTLQLKMRDLGNEEDDQCEYLSPSHAESVGSPCSQYFSDQEISVLSSECLGSHISGKVDSNSEAKAKYQNGDLLRIPIDWEDGDPNFENHSNDCDHANNAESLHNRDGDMARLNSCSSSSNDMPITHFEDQTHISELESVKSSCSSIEQVSCTNSISFGGDIGVAQKFVSEDGFVTSGVPVHSLEDLQMDRDPIRHELVMDESICDGKVEEDNFSNELLVERAHVSGPTEGPDLSSCKRENCTSQLCAESESAGGILACDNLSNVKTESEDSPNQMRFQVQQGSCPVDSSPHSCDSSNLIAVKLNGDDDSLIDPRSVGHSEASRQLIIGNNSVISTETDSFMARYDNEAFDVDTLSSEHTQEHSKHGVMDVAVSRSETPQSYSSTCNELEKDSIEYPEDSPETWVISEDHKPLDASNNVKPISIDDDVVVNGLSTIVADHQPGAEDPGNKENTGDTHPQSEEDIEKEDTEHNKQEIPTKDMPQHKPQKKLLKSVVKGTAVLGIAAFLLHLRKNRQQNLSQARKQLVETSKKGPKSSNNTSSVYPAEKLNFGF